MDPMTELASIPPEVNGLKILKMLMNTNANKVTNKMMPKNSLTFQNSIKIHPKDKKTKELLPRLFL
mgnify:CR=1 FL=1